MNVTIINNTGIIVNTVNQSMNGTIINNTGIIVTPLNHPLVITNMSLSFLLQLISILLFVTGLLLLATRFRYQPLKSRGISMSIMELMCVFAIWMIVLAKNPFDRPQFGFPCVLNIFILSFSPPLVYVWPLLRNWTFYLAYVKVVQQGNYVKVVKQGNEQVNDQKQVREQCHIVKQGNEQVSDVNSIQKYNDVKQGNEQVRHVNIQSNIVQQGNEQVRHVTSIYI